MAIGIICEYNPFHYGHLHHLEEIKKKYPDEEICLVLSGNYTQRGNLSILEKFDKAKIALCFGVNLVVELPFHFATQSADIFAKGAIMLLEELGCDKIVFGSESNQIERIITLAKAQLENGYQEKVKQELQKKVNYPTALSNALKDTVQDSVFLPNDLLALSYVREIIKNHYPITPVSIQRTNCYHEEQLSGKISSATSIRKALHDGISVEEQVPKEVLSLLQEKDPTSLFFPFLKYKILSEQEEIKKYQDVDEGMEHRILKYIESSSTLEELMQKIKTKRYTYQRLNRMFTHILCSFTKEEAKNRQNCYYLRILGMDEKGRIYLHKQKKEIHIPIISNITKENISLLSLELRCDAIYHFLLSRDENLLAKKPIIQK